MPEIKTSLGVLRAARGISAIHLANTIGVSRQTIYAMESGSYVPNTAVALRLARVLETSVEELFTLAEEPPNPKLRSTPSMLLPGGDSPHPGQAVQLCQVDQKLMAAQAHPVPWHFPSSDAIIAENADLKGKARVQIFLPEDDFNKRILIAGCDPGISVLARHARGEGVEMVLAHRNSTQALALLKKGCVHIAGTHLTDEFSGESNLAEIRRLFPKNSVAVFSFALWEQGILTAQGNPKHIIGIEDFGRKDISIANREKGSGSRVLVDRCLKKAGIESQNVQGYDRLAAGHLAAAWQVESRAVDCCVATRAVARLFGFHFIPLASERYDLVIRRQHLDLPGVQRVLAVLNRSGLRRELECLGGYDTWVTGQRVV